MMIQLIVITLASSGGTSVLSVGSNSVTLTAQKHSEADRIRRDGQMNCPSEGLQILRAELAKKFLNNSCKQAKMGLFRPFGVGFFQLFRTDKLDGGGDGKLDGGGFSGHYDLTAV